VHKKPLLDPLLIEAAAVSLNQALHATIFARPGNSPRHRRTVAPLSQLRSQLGAVRRQAPHQLSRRPP